MMSEVVAVKTALHPASLLASVPLPLTGCKKMCKTQKPPRSSKTENGKTIPPRLSTPRRWISRKKQRAVSSLQRPSARLRATRVALLW